MTFDQLHPNERDDILQRCITSITTARTRAQQNDFVEDYYGTEWFDDAVRTGELTRDHIAESEARHIIAAGSAANTMLRGLTHQHDQPRRCDVIERRDAKIAVVRREYGVLYECFDTLQHIDQSIKVDNLTFDGEPLIATARGVISYKNR